MKILALCFVALVAAVAADGVSDDVNKKTTHLPDTTTAATTTTGSSSTSSEVPKTSSEAPKTTTTEAPTSTTVGPKTTTTEAPKTTTTEAPTSTTVGPKTTTTEAPKTTTEAPTSTTVAPTTPAPSSQPWIVTDGNKTCIMMEMTVSVEVSYPMADGNKTQTTITVPASAKASGACGQEEQKISLTWGTNEIDMVFQKNETNYMLSKVSFMVPVDEKTFPNISSSFLNQTLALESSSMEFKTPVNQSYRCMREESLSLRSSSFNSTNAALRLSKVQLQAFHTETKAEFGNAQDCELDTPDIVPIAVGCALAGLVALVLVAYLVGRRRSQALGYLSM